MQLDRRSLVLGGTASASCATMLLDARAPDETIPLWPEGPPGAPSPPPQETMLELGHANYQPDRALEHVSRPRLDVFRPERSDGSAVLLAPGGGYRRVVLDREAYETARWLAARGATAFVLTHRLPADRWEAGPDTPLQDAQRAMRIVRREASRFGCSRFGAVGFSAGGHVMASLLTRFDARVYASVDHADALSARPDIAGLVYPVMTMRPPHAHADSRRYLLGDAPTEAQLATYSPEANVRADAPPTFIVHAMDDTTVPVANSMLFCDALRRAGVASEAHYFEEGGHGFGLRGAQGKPAAVWIDLFYAWAARKGLFRA